MRWPRRATRLSDSDRALLGLAEHERVLAVARGGDGAPVVATDQAVVTPHWRVAWADALHAQWLDGDERLEVTGVLPDGDVVERTVRLDEPGRVPEAVHERVVATILLSRVLSARGQGRVRVVARRQPGDDEVVWQVVPDRGVDLAAPEVAARVEAAKAEMAGELGL